MNLNKRIVSTVIPPPSSVNCDPSSLPHLKIEKLKTTKNFV